MAADPTSFWPKFNDYSWPDIDESCTDEFGEGVAAQVLEEYGIPLASNSTDIGGVLANVDIKHMDCMTVIKASLFDESAKDGIIREPMVNEDGEVEFVEIGAGANTADMDIYYTVQTQTYKEPCRGVMITGQKPLIRRLPITWKPIWGTDITKRKVYSLQGMQTNCSEPNFKTWATVVFPDPHMNSTFEDGIDNLYNITRGGGYADPANGESTAHDKIVGYAYFIHHGDLATEDTGVAYQRQAKAILEIGEDGTSQYGPNVGTLWEREAVLPGQAQECWFPVDADAPPHDAGVGVNIPEDLRFERRRSDEPDILKTDNFMGISEVFVVGIELDRCKGQPDNPNNPNTADNTHLWIGASNATRKTMKLNEGEHYVVIYPEGDSGYKEARIVFANSSRTDDFATYGTDAEYFYLQDGGELWTQMNPTPGGVGTVLPLGGVRGFLIEEMWASVDLDTPSFVITDPRGNAYNIAEQLEVLVAPIVIRDVPAPIAFNGEIVDQDQNMFDNDPTTEENLEDTEFEKRLELMAGGGLTLNFSYLNEDEIKDLSNTLWRHMNSTSTRFETTYTCGPDSDPKLGDTAPNDGTVNSIRYSYSDSAAYTISVNAGPLVIGNFAELSQGLYFKQQNEASGMQGTVIQDEGNHVVFKVKIDGYGDTYAVNLCASIIRSGDIVSCTIHNNPVGEQ